MSGATFTWRAGGCHCGAVRFEARLADEVEAQTCNCSMCEKTGFVHVIVPESRFRLLQGARRADDVHLQHRRRAAPVLPVCGVKSFYRPRSNPDGWSVNARCLDEATRPATDALRVRRPQLGGPRRRAWRISPKEAS